MDHIEGILSNWDSIEATIRTGLHTDYGKSKDIQDILDIIHELQISAVTVSPLRTLFNEHITDISNPHNVSINISDLDVIQVLYSEYTNLYGAELTISEFTQLIVALRKMATRADVDNHTNLNAVMSPDVMEYITERHDADPDAHSELFRYKLPGIPLQTPPVCSLDPSLISENQITVNRNCSMNYHDISGRILSVGPNEIAADFLFGVPSIPIFGLRRNILLHSKDLANVTLYNGSRVTSGGPFIISPTDDVEYLMFQEDNTDSTHGFSDVFIESIDGTQNYSIYVFPIDRRSFQISFMDNLLVERIVAKFNLDTKESVVDVQNAISLIHELSNGWYRFDITFVATGLNITQAKISIMKQVIGDDYGIINYQGTSVNGAVFYQHQLTAGALSVPPIFTTDIPVSCLGTKLSKDFSDLINKTRGTFSIKYISPLPELFPVNCEYVRIFNNTTGMPMVEARTNPNDPSKNQIITTTNSGIGFTSINSEPYFDEAMLSRRVAFSYTPGYQSYGFTDNIPRTFRIEYNSTADLIIRFFRDIYEPSGTGGRILQLSPDEIPDDAFDIDGSLPVNHLDYVDEHQINQSADTIEIGYSSQTDVYLEGYLLNFKYYAQFANVLNIEFLMDQYVPNN